MEISRWTPLKLTDTPNTPLLLVDFNITQDGYSFYLTDLANLWAERLTRKQIIRRSLDINTSIDPTESTQQYCKFLEKIEDGLRESEGSSLHLFRADEKPESLELLLINKLTPPLSALVWPLHLKALSREWLREILVLPIIENAVMQLEETKKLRNLLEEKDQIITKLCNQIQASGTDLGSVFPNASGLKIPRKTDVRSHLAPYVKGLGVFKTDEWSMKSQFIHRTSERFVDRLQQVFGTLPRREVDVERLENNMVSDWPAQLNSLNTKQLNEILDGKDKSFEITSLEMGLNSVHTLDRLFAEGIKQSDDDNSCYKHEADEERQSPSDMTSVENAKFATTPHACDRVDISSFKGKEPEIKKLGMIGGRRRDNARSMPYREVDEEKERQDREDHNLKGGARTIERAEQSTHDQSDEVSPVNTSSVKSKVRNKIGGRPNMKILQTLENSPADFSANPASRSTQHYKTQERASTDQNSDKTAVVPSISSKEKADQKRERLRQEAKSQHPVPLAKRRKF